MSARSVRPITPTSEHSAPVDSLARGLLVFMGPKAKAMSDVDIMLNSDAEDIIRDYLARHPGLSREQKLALLNRARQIYLAEHEHPHHHDHHHEHPHHHDHHHEHPHHHDHRHEHPHHHDHRHEHHHEHSHHHSGDLSSSRKPITRSYGGATSSSQDTVEDRVFSFNNIKDGLQGYAVKVNGQLRYMVNGEQVTREAFMEAANF